MKYCTDHFNDVDNKTMMMTTTTTMMDVMNTAVDGRKRALLPITAVSKSLNKIQRTVNADGYLPLK